jgi:protein gp37
MLMHDKLEEPLHWRKPRKVFVNSMSDLFHEDVPDEFIRSVLCTIGLARQHTFQVLTKRPKRMRDFMSSFPPLKKQTTRGCELIPFLLPNLWLGVSVEDQKTADERIPPLLYTPAAVRWVSLEPLLGPVDLRCVAPWDDFHTDALDTPDPAYRLDWAVVGGESGPKARPVDEAWIGSIVNQCQGADVPVFVKQMGSVWAKESGAKHSKGGDISEWPEWAQVREWPR